MAKVYKMVVMAIDFEGMSDANVIQTIESNRYLSVEVCESQSHTVAWDDNHPLNHRNTSRAAFDELFAVAPKEPAAQGGVPDWAACMAITDVPSVHEAMDAFGHDMTGDNATCIVKAIFEAAAAPTGASK